MGQLFFYTVNRKEKQPETEPKQVKNTGKHKKEK